MNWSRREMSAESVASTNEPFGAASSDAGQVIPDRVLPPPPPHLSTINNPEPPTRPLAATQRQRHSHSPLAGAIPFAASLIAATATTTTSTLTTESSNATKTTMEQQQTTTTTTFSEWWDEYWSRQPFPSGYTQSSITMLACFISTIIFLIVVGNLLVCIAIFTEKSLKPTQNWFIASLAVSDMLLGLVVMPFSLARELMGFWVFGPLWCDIHEAVDVLLTTASINTLCLISLDRYWSITQAVSYLKKRTPRRGAFMIAFVWVFSAAVSLPPLFGWKKQQTPIVIPSKATNQSAMRPANTYSDTIASNNNNNNNNNNADYDNVPGGVDEPDSDLERQQQQQRRRKRRQFSQLATPLPRQHRNYLQDDQQQTSFIAADNGLATSSTPSPADQQQLLLSDYPTCQLSDDLGYVLYSALGSFYIPCAVMVFTYIKIFLAARSRARRAISKQGRTGGANKRAANAASAAAAANRRAITPQATNKQLAVQQQQQGCNASTISGQVTSCANSLNGSNNQLAASRNIAAADALKPPVPIMKGGKIVIVERKKSLAPGLAQASAGVSDMSSSLAAIQQQQRQQRNQADRKSDNSQSASNLALRPQESHCTLTTSGAKQASPSALNSSASNDSSMITVMHASMAEVPQVTRFSFREPSGGGGGNAKSKCEDEGARKAAALLDAIRQVSANGQQLVSEVLDEDAEKQVPDIVVERRGTDAAPFAPLAADEQQQDRSCADGAQQLNATSETCFMTIEEDSDMFESQTGRTITMVAGNATQRQTSNLAKSQAGATIVTMMPASQPSVVCSDATCRSASNRPATTTTTSARSASSYCGSSMTINDDDIDECDDDDDDDDDGDDDVNLDEDEPLTDECNGYSCSAGYDHYCQGDQDLSSTCGHCHECEQDERQTTLASSAGLNTRHLSIGEGLSPVRARQQQAKHHHHHRQQQQQAKRLQKPKQQQQQEDTTEVQSFTGDDNLSLTEYRSNEDDENSSIIGHDVLDATDSTKRRGGDAEAAHRKQQSSISGPANQERKKSSIGFRLARLGSTTPLSNYSGGLLALASNSQQQQASGGGTRNLKALRQNFFLKLNQLTAKSATKQQQQQHKRPTSPIGGKSSAQSSGTSYEPSVDYATTSNIHSNDNPQETTIGNESEQHSSDDLVHRQQSSDDNKSKNLINNGTTTTTTQQQPQDQEAKVGARREADNVKFARHGDKTVLLKESKDSAETDLETTDVASGADTQKRQQGERLDQMVGRISSGLVSSSKPAAAVGVGASFAPSGHKTQRFDLDNHHGGGHHHRNSGQTALTAAAAAPGGGGGGKKRPTHSSAMLSSASAGSGQPTSQRAYLASDNERHKRKLAKARERRATLILGLIMAAFICSWLPFFTFYVLRAVCSSCKDSVSPRIEAFIFWMGYCNSAINPIIYTIFNRDFRKAFRKILFKCL